MHYRITDKHGSAISVSEVKIDSYELSKIQNIVFQKFIELGAPLNEYVLREQNAVPEVLSDKTAALIDLLDDCVEYLSGHFASPAYRDGLIERYEKLQNQLNAREN